MEIMDYIIGERLILIPVLYVLGYAIKNTNIIRDKMIPIFLILIGILLSILMGGNLVDNILQGILVAGATVLTNQVIKQTSKEE